MSRSSNTVAATTTLEGAVTAFASGSPVLIHDAADREGEVDLVYPAAAVAPTDVARMRNDAGGLICVALPDSICATWELPLVQRELDHPAAGSHELGYDERSSFSLTVNHRETFTGITDEDRALTISALADAAGRVQRAKTLAGDGAEASLADGAERFAATFRAPGHVHVLRAAPDLLADRQGHTELGIALADAAGAPPAVVVCEMLDDETGGALSPEAARAYADRNGFPYLEGAELVARFGE